MNIYIEITRDKLKKQQKLPAVAIFSYHLWVIVTSGAGSESSFPLSDY